MRGLGYPSAIASSLHQLPRRDECIAVNTFLHNEVKLYIRFNFNYLYSNDIHEILKKAPMKVKVFKTFLDHLFIVEFSMQFQKDFWSILCIWFLGFFAKFDTCNHKTNILMISIISGKISMLFFFFIWYVFANFR